MAQAFPPSLLAEACQVEMVFPSVSGHLTELDFTAAHKGWRSCGAQELYSAPVFTSIPQAGPLRQR